MGILSNLLGGSSAKVASFKEKGAVVVDVRSPEEFRGGHVKNAKNIPLQDIEKRADELARLKKPIILCCASGMRSGRATSFLSKKGIECINGGSWMSVNQQYQ